MYTFWTCTDPTVYTLLFWLNIPFLASI
jgi:hypothetical protein